MSKYGDITFSAPVPTKPNVGQRGNSDSITAFTVNGQPIRQIPEVELREEITKAALAKGLIVKSFGTFPELEKKDHSGIGLRVEVMGPR